MHVDRKNNKMRKFHVIFGGSGSMLTISVTQVVENFLFPAAVEQ